MKKKSSDHEKRSVCEKSMELVVKIIKISSFSLAGMNLVSGQRLVPIIKSSTNSEISKSKRLMSKSYKGEEEDGDGNFCDYITKFHARNKNEAITDGRAAAFIRKFHEKNSRLYTLAAPPVLPLPPPPPSLKK